MIRDSLTCPIRLPIMPGPGAVPGGRRWSADVSGTTLFLGPVACHSPNLCKAAGDLGTILTWNGRTGAPTPAARRRASQRRGLRIPQFLQGGLLRRHDPLIRRCQLERRQPYHHADSAYVACVSTRLCKAVCFGGTILSLPTPGG
jgi:hypothetical protein